MRTRRRGEDTKLKVLDEACKVFAEKGYRDATHAEICGRAGANAAAVNYYFGSKEGLYRAVFERLEDQVERMYPLDGGLPETASPEKRLHAFIHGHLSRMYDPELMGDLHRIRMAEMFDPTGLLDDLLEANLAKHRRVIQRVAREFLGPKASQRDVDWCEMSVVGQCFIGGPGPVGKMPPDKGPRALFGLNASEVDVLADHIHRFSLAGIKAIARKLESDPGVTPGSEDATKPSEARKRKQG
jgi:AcrR family transcriptional regulator